MPDRLMATIWSQPSTETFLKLRFGRLMPALLTRMSMRPWRLRIAAAIFATSGLSATSTASASPLPAALSCFSAAASVSWLRPEMTTCAPARESSIAPARPIPEPPPVIQATLPASILSGAEEYFRLLLAEAGGLPAALRQYFYAALHRRPRGNAVAPALHAGILVDVHALAIRRAQPRHDRHVGDAVFAAGDPLAVLQLFFYHPVKPVGLVLVAVARVFDLLGRVLQEMVRLPEHRADVPHLEHGPLHHLPAVAQVARQELAGLGGEVEQHRARLGERERLPARAFLVDHRRDLVIGRDGEEFRLELVTRSNIDGMNFIFETSFLQHDVNLVAIGRGPCIEVDHGLPLFIVGNDYGACNLIVPALLAPVERDPHEAQIQRQRRNEVAEEAHRKAPGGRRAAGFGIHDPRPDGDLAGCGALVAPEQQRPRRDDEAGRRVPVARHLERKILGAERHHDERAVHDEHQHPVDQERKQALPEAHVAPHRAPSGQLHQLLAEVLAAEQRDQALGRVLQALDDRLAVLELALREVLAERLERLAVALLPVEHDHALHPDAVDEHQAQVPQSVRLGRAVVGDHAADDDARKKVGEPQHRVEDLAADVVEIHIGALRAGGLQVAVQAARLVIDAGVEAELARHVLGFLAAAGDADGVAAPDLRELPDDAADRARGRGHHHGLARLRQADFLQAEVRGHARHAEDAEVTRERRARAVDLADLLRASIELPAELC